MNCKEEKEHHAKGLCYACYKKLKWQPKFSICKRCQQKRNIHAKNLCVSCYNQLFHLEKNKEYNQRKTNNIDLKTFRKVTKSCALCGFNKIVDFHYIDLNKKNQSSKNIVGLCPNHHRMVHNYNFRQEIFQLLKEKGYDLPIEEKIFSQKNTLAGD